MSIKSATKRIPNIYELFYDKNGNLLKSPDTIMFKAQDNYANLLVINLEDNVEDDSLVLINFTPKNSVVNYTTHWFYVRPTQNVREYIIDGENTPRVFSSYVFEVPRIVLNNYVRNTTVENAMTIVKRYGFNDVGVFNKYSDLTLNIPATQELYDTNGFAYILNDETIGDVLHKRGYYQVIEVSNGVYEWTIRENVMNFGLEQKQYEVKNAFVESGYANINNVPNVESTVIEALWRDLSVIINDINDLKSFYDLELLVESGYYDEVTNELVLVLANGSDIRIPVGNLLTDLDAHNIRFNGSGTNYLTAKTEVESAVKELDTQVKTNADNVALKVNTSDIVNNLTSTDTDKPLSANQGKMLNDTTAKLAVSNVFTQPQQVPNATLPQHATNKLQVETMFEMFKQQLRGYNLASPDLISKEYLGNGVYRLYNDNGVTLDYNIYNGIYTLNKSSDYLGFINISNINSSLGTITLQSWVINGIEQSFLDIMIREPKEPYVVIGAGKDYDKISKTLTTETLLSIYLDADDGFNNFQFKLQIEKGSTATPYTVPGEIPQYKIVGEE